MMQNGLLGPSSNSIRVSFTTVCITATLFGTIVFGFKEYNKAYTSAKAKWKQSSKSSLDNSFIDAEAVHKFYLAVQQSPTLYPYFMNVKVESREDVIQKIACSFHKVLEKKIITDADAVMLEAVHEKLNIDEDTYNMFTKLFAHICCENKSVLLRMRMYETFTLMKNYICRDCSSKNMDISAFLNSLDEDARKTSQKHGHGHPRTQNQCPVTTKFGFPQNSARSIVMQRANDLKRRAALKLLERKISDLEASVRSLLRVNDALSKKIECLHLEKSASC